MALPGRESLTVTVSGIQVVSTRMKSSLNNSSYCSQPIPLTSGALDYQCRRVMMILLLSRKDGYLRALHSVAAWMTTCRFLLRAWETFHFNLLSYCHVVLQFGKVQWLFLCPARQPKERGSVPTVHRQKPSQVQELLRIGSTTIVGDTREYFRVSEGSQYKKAI